jgi:hypothetical protein
MERQTQRPKRELKEGQKTDQLKPGDRYQCRGVNARELTLSGKPSGGMNALACSLSASPCPVKAVSVGRIHAGASLSGPRAEGKLQPS